MMELVSWGYEIPNWMEKSSKCSKPPTNYLWAIMVKLTSKNDDFTGKTFWDFFHEKWWIELMDLTRNIPSGYVKIAIESMAHLEIM